MILPTKHISPDRALLTVGGRILTNLSRPRTSSATWERILASTRGEIGGVRYEEYVLALDLLFMIGAVELRDGLLYRRSA